MAFDEVASYLMSHAAKCTLEDGGHRQRAAHHHLRPSQHPSRGGLLVACVCLVYLCMTLVQEITYDYMFAIDEADKVPCSCGAAKCRGWMN